MNGNVLKADAFIPALGWSWRGVAWREEHFFRFWIYMNIGLALLAFGLPIAPGLRVLILCLGTLVLTAGVAGVAWVFALWGLL